MCGFREDNRGHPHHHSGCSSSPSPSLSLPLSLSVWLQLMSFLQRLLLISCLSCHSARSARCYCGIINAFKWSACLLPPALLSVLVYLCVRVCVCVCVYALCSRKLNKAAALPARAKLRLSANINSIVSPIPRKKKHGSVRDDLVARGSCLGRVWADAKCKLQSGHAANSIKFTSRAWTTLTRRRGPYCNPVSKEAKSWLLSSLTPEGKGRERERGTNTNCQHCNDVYYAMISIFKMGNYYPMNSMTK